ncbi:MAG: hypothetical protein KF866_08565 [Phycisphaeraceae bacterium]|nr:hypothetical protein [Phycisphaeraceae bacterium]
MTVSVSRYRRDFVRNPVVGWECSGREAAMRRFVDVAWEEFGGEGSGRGVSWIGFYGKGPGEDLILLERRDKPACSPIGLHGMCGRSWLSRRVVIVDDVRTLGEGYIACDPRDLSELVIPLFEPDGTCWGVLDVDSYATGAFGPDDAAGFGGWLKALGLTREAPDVSSMLRL